jgi:hypothetical protein
LKEKRTIGRKDKVDFPKFSLQEIDIKMDTGAYTSSIHCHKIETKEKDGKEVVVFTLLDPSHPQYDKQELSTGDYHEKVIKNSFGHSEKRFIIETTILFFGEEYPIKLSLSERGEMKYPVLIGRRFLMGKFVVDTAKYNLSYKESKLKI